MSKVFCIIKLVIMFCLLFVISTFALLIPNNRVYEMTEETETVEETIVEKEITIDDIILKNVEIGDIVRFGRFYDVVDDEIKKVEIRWIVLDKLGDSALLMSSDILKMLPYNEIWEFTSWEKSTARKWLNHDFYDIAFTDLEKELIDKIITKNIGNVYTNITEEYDTKDNVFILSIEEARKYFDNANKLMAVGTNYAKSEGLWISKYPTSKGYSVWWLRNPGKSKTFASLIHAAGSIGFNGDNVATKGNGIRPCIWVKVK